MSLTNIKNRLISFNSKLLPHELAGNKRKTILFYLAIYLIVLSTFLTVISQLPVFTVRGLTQIFQIGWIICFIPLFMLDYKRVLKLLFYGICLITPFLLYCAIALLFGIKSISYGGTTYVLLCSYLFLIFGTFAKYKQPKTTKLICATFLISTFIYALIVFFTVLLGYDLSNQIYAFADKNSAGPIFISAAILGFYVFDKKDWISTVLKWSIFIFFVIIIALSKTRSVLITLPIIFFVLLFLEVKNAKIAVFVLLAFIIAIVLVAVVPFLRETIIINILFNGKTDLDSIFSGRLTQIIVNMQNIKPVLGSGGTYFDCMILSLLCSYGVVGFISLLPFLIFPFFILYRYRAKCKNRTLRAIITSFIIVFSISSLLEGFGYIGTGAKVFIFWYLIGNYTNEVLPVVSTHKVLEFFRKIENKIISIPKNVLLVSIQFILIVASIASISLVSFSASIGEMLVDKLPSSNVVAPYVEVKDIQINPPVQSMCVGQRITFGVKTDPIDADDAVVRWGTGWIQNPCISVDAYSGEVTADKTGSALLHINRFRIAPNGTYIQFPVTEVSNYNFNKLAISTNKFNKSFEYYENEEIVLGYNCTSKLFYDEFYLPDDSLIEFVSSDTSIAKIEDGFIKAMSPGTCKIHAIVHGKEDTNSINEIKVSVEDNVFIPVEFVDMDANFSWYQYQEYELSPSFNQNASDQNFSVEILGLQYKTSNNKITFTETGQATIKVISDNDKTVFCTKQIEVLPNSPECFECETDRILIGEMMDATQLGLYLKFKNGYKKIVTEDDLFYDPGDFTNRAWSNQNGLIKNRTTIKAIKKGIITISFVSKIDQNITSTFKITSSAYTHEAYEKITKGMGEIVVSTLFLGTVVFSIFVSIKNDYLTTLVIGFATIVFAIISFVVFGFNMFSIISIILIVLFLIGISILRLLKKKMPIYLLETPIEIEYKEENIIEIINYLQLEI